MNDSLDMACPKSPPTDDNGACFFTGSEWTVMTPYTTSCEEYMIRADVNECNNEFTARPTGRRSRRASMHDRPIQREPRRLYRESGQVGAPLMPIENIGNEQESIAKEPQVYCVRARQVFMRIWRTWREDQQLRT